MRAGRDARAPASAPTSQVPDFLDQIREAGDSQPAMRSRLQERFERAVRELLAEAGSSEPPPDFSLEVPRSAEHGDFACNAALLLAKPLAAPAARDRPAPAREARRRRGRDRPRRGGRARLRQRLAARRALAGAAARRARAGAPLRPLAAGRRPAGAGRVRLRESDRAAHARPRPPGRARRLHRARCSKRSATASRASTTSTTAGARCACSASR